MFTPVLFQVFAGKGCSLEAGLAAPRPGESRALFPPDLGRAGTTATFGAAALFPPDL